MSIRHREALAVLTQSLLRATPASAEGRSKYLSADSICFRLLNKVPSPIGRRLP
jgi:hypothetical protein